MLNKADKYLANVDARMVILVLLALLVILGFSNRFIQDDAFISFRYAENFVAGHGLTWNIGDEAPIEGYTNFLWVILMAGAHALNLDPVPSSMGLGLALGFGTLLFSYRLALLISRPDESQATALLAIVMLGTNYTFSSYMTGGLETQLQTFLIVLSAWFAFRMHENTDQASNGRLAFLSILFSLAIMTRLDTALFCLVLYFFCIFSIRAKVSVTGGRMVSIIFLTTPGALIVGAWLLFKIIYYGDILPNTFYVKVVDDAYGAFLIGASYIWFFILQYSLFIFIILLPLYFKRLFANSAYRVVLLISTVLWMLYIAKVGGDFMEFRFMVPALPFAYLLVADLIRLIRSAAAQMAIVLLLLVSSAYHGVTFDGKAGIESVRALNAHIVSEEENWAGTGIRLGELLFDSPTPVTIAVTAAGAIPYYSKLRTIDMLGLNDRYVARHGLVLGARPGHTRGASMDYLLDSKVNLVLGHPTVKPLDAAPTLEPAELNLKVFMPTDDTDASSLPDNARILEIPLNDAYRLDVLYLIPHPHIDDMIDRLNLKTHRIES
jgi:arabinofuranosyltransferase